MLRKERFLNGLENGTTRNGGEEFEFAMAVVYPTTRYYPHNASSKSGDLVALGTHYQVKGHRGFFQNIANIEELEEHLFKVCKADRYLLRVTNLTKWQWIDIDKHQVLELARAGYIKFEYAGKSRGNVARWSITKKESQFLNMRYGIKVMTNTEII